jgi:hypothetical protein
MPRRTLLSSEQRTRLFAIPIDPAEMARHNAAMVRRNRSSALATVALCGLVTPFVPVLGARHKTGRIARLQTTRLI